MKAIIITIVLVTIVALGSDILIALLRALGLLTGHGILG